MNYLAHAFLSGEDELLLFGNFIADGIRGNQFLHLPIKIQQGIFVHRRIDSYTDLHEINEEARKALRPIAGKYSGVVLDILYDHLLAISWENYSSTPLALYVNWCYDVVEQQKEWLPEKTSYMFPYMRKGNWLLNYSKKEGILQSLNGLSQRISGSPPLLQAGEFAFENLELFRELFDEFFPLLQKEVNAIVGAGLK